MGTVTIAIAKGRTANQTIAILQKAGIVFPEFHKNTRKLIFLDQTKQFKLVYVKAVDVPIYVEKGAADIGIVGKDNILEAQADVYDMLDLQFGKCKFVVAGLPDTNTAELERLTVATKYPAVTINHFQQTGKQIDTIKLNGSVELAPLIGLSDVIVDIVETGTTIKENGLKIMDTIEDISTRLIVNKASLATKPEQIHQLMDQIKQVLEVTSDANNPI